MLNGCCQTTEEVEIGARSLCSQSQSRNWSERVSHCFSIDGAMRYSFKTFSRIPLALCPSRCFSRRTPSRVRSRATFRRGLRTDGTLQNWSLLKTRAIVREPGQASVRFSMWEREGALLKKEKHCAGNTMCRGGGRILKGPERRVFDLEIVQGNGLVGHLSFLLEALFSL